MLKWTSVFVCPMTGELFLSGNYHGSTGTCSDESLWFSKKTHAEHGAAARAYDCLLFRDQLQSDRDVQVKTSVGLEEPYSESEAVYKLPQIVRIPPDVRDMIERMQQEIRRVNGLAPLS